MNANHVDIYVSVHKGLRNLISRFSFRTGSTDWVDALAVRELHADWVKAMKLIRSHHSHEDRFIHPLLARISPGGHRNYEADHQSQLNMLADLDGHFRNLMEGEHSATRQAEIGLEFYRGLNLFYADFLKHLHREEVEAERILNSLCLPEELMSLMAELLGSIPQDEMLLYIDYMFPAMNLPECIELLGNLKSGAPVESFIVLADRVRKARGEADWQKIKSLLKL
jgi:hypothetical protein